ncbi:MAG: ABC transporter ATP-binding protein [Asgard group archaeon]|nr:ABC transporter ATP-binding protein [Asgard group archaeon]
MSPTVKYTFSLLRKYLKPYVQLVATLGAIIVLYNTLQIFIPQVLRIYIDAAMSGTFDYKFLLTSSLIYIAANLLHRILMVIMRYISIQLAWLTTNDLRVDLTSHCINLDMTFHNKLKTGDMIERIDGDSTTLSEFFSTFSIYFLGSFLVIFGVLVAVFIEGWVYGVTFLGYTLVAFLAIFSVRNVVAPFWKKLRESTTALYGNIEESVSGLEDIQPNGAGSYIMKRFHDFSRTNFKDGIKSAFYSRIYFLLTILMRAVINLVILVIAGYFSDSLGINIGELYLLLTYASTILWPIRLIIWQIDMMQNSIANIDRIKEFFDMKSKIEDTGTEVFPDRNIKLIFDNLSFGYKEDELVLKNINFNLLPEKKIGLVGKTGSGKTTIARLIFRLYDPNDGAIRINGHTARDYPLSELRQNIAYVTQDVELFKASLKDNITFFNKEITDEQVLNVIHELGLKDWFDKLPNGLESVIYSDEVGLSAGEEQLLALTRAFLKNPKIVILDEASSRLDPATERQVENALEKLLHGRSAIIIAHRLPTLEKVDDIIILSQGEIIEAGSRSDLVSNPDSLFSELIHKGMEGYLT